MTRSIRKSMIATALFVVVAVSLLAAPVNYAQNRGIGKDFATRSVAMGTRGMAATSQPLATMTALDILKRGGHAVDAAIAANAVLGLVEPTGNGIGGDLFVIIWDNENKRVAGFNGSGRSPKSLTLAEFRRQQLESIPTSGRWRYRCPAPSMAGFRSTSATAAFPSARCCKRRSTMRATDSPSPR